MPSLQWLRRRLVLFTYTPGRCRAVRCYSSRLLDCVFPLSRRPDAGELVIRAHCFLVYGLAILLFSDGWCWTGLGGLDRWSVDMVDDVVSSLLLLCRVPSYASLPMGYSAVFLWACWKMRAYGFLGGLLIDGWVVEWEIKKSKI